MNVKALVVVLVALVVATALVLFYGALRPPANGNDAREGVAGSLGWLVPSRTLSFDDVRDAACADPETSRLVVAAGTSCTVQLPNPSEIYLCSNRPASLTVRTRGEDYPDQRVGAVDLSCAAPGRIPIYDTGTVLAVRCAGFAPCVVRVVLPPDG